MWIFQQPQVVLWGNRYESRRKNQKIQTAERITAERSCNNVQNERVGYTQL